MRRVCVGRTHTAYSAQHMHCSLFRVDVNATTTQLTRLNFDSFFIDAIQFDVHVIVIATASDCHQQSSSFSVHRNSLSCRQTNKLHPHSSNRTLLISRFYADGNEAARQHDECAMGNGFSVLRMRSEFSRAIFKVERKF